MLYFELTSIPCKKGFNDDRAMTFLDQIFDTHQATG